MPLSTVYPFGLRQVRLLDAAGTNAVALPGAMLLHFVERMGGVEFTAEGVAVGAASRAVALDWELEAGGLSLAAWAKLTGRTASDAGSTPNQTKTLAGDTDEAFPYLRIQGRSVGDSGDDVYVTLYRAKVTSFDGSWRGQEFWVTACAGVAVRDSTNGLFQVVQRETAAAL